MENSNELVFSAEAAKGICQIVLNQPRKKNAINARMMDLLSEQLLAADEDNSVRVIILRGVDGNFSSGGDLNQNSSEESSPEYARKTLRHYGMAIRTIRHISKPVIAMVDGYAIGGAFALVLASDLVCASEGAVFMPAFCQIGIIPEMGIMKYLPELVGPQRAKEILFFGDRISSKKLYELGLVNRVFSTESLEDGTLSYAQTLAEMPDASIQITKNIMNSLADENLDVVLSSELTASPFCTTTKAYAQTMAKYAK